MADPTEQEISFARVSQTAFEGATTNYRLEQRGLVNGDSDTLAARELKLLWQRSAYAYRNNGWAKTARTKFRRNQGNIEVKWKDAGGKEHKKMQNLWNEFIKTPNKDGYGTLTNTQDEWNMGLFDGEIFCRKLISSKPNRTIPLVLQNIPKEYLDPAYSGLDKENTRNGITFVDGVPSVYNFNKKRSNDLIVNNSEKIAVPSDEVAHIFIREEPGQWRGIPMLAPALLSLYDLDDLTDATINKQKAAQAVAWIIENTNPISALSVGTAMQSLDQNDIDSSTGKRRIITQASGGGTHYLNKGERMVFYQGTDIGANLPELIKSELRKVLETCGLNYVYASGDLEKISLSALQYISQEMKIRAEFIYTFYTINLGLQKVCDWFQELAGIYVNKNLTTLIPSFIFPRRYGMNDLKDAQADKLELDSDMTTLERVLSERGLTMEEVIADKKKRKENGLETLPNNASMNQPNNINANSNTRG